MTTLATHPLEDPDLIGLLADGWTPLSLDDAARFRRACWNVALAHDGWVDPNRVRAQLLNKHDELDIEPRKFSSLWATACARDGYLDITKRRVQITGPGSRGNSNKEVRYRRWRDWNGATA